MDRLHKDRPVAVTLKLCIRRAIHVCVVLIIGAFAFACGQLWLRWPGRTWELFCARVVEKDVDGCQLLLDDTWTIRSIQGETPYLHVTVCRDGATVTRPVPWGPPRGAMSALIWDEVIPRRHTYLDYVLGVDSSECWEIQAGKIRPRGLEPWNPHL